MNDFEARPFWILTELPDRPVRGIDGQANRQTTDGWMDGQIDGRTDRERERERERETEREREKERERD